MKSPRILSLSKTGFARELRIKGSRVNRTPLMWTWMWLDRNGGVSKMQSKALKTLGDWTYATADNINQYQEQALSGCAKMVLSAKEAK